MSVPIRYRVSLVGLLLVSVGLAAQSSNPQPQVSGPHPPPSNSATTESQEGEKLFQTQCGRCHALPEDLSPREAKAVVRQMRVRANLTAEEERLILKYLAP